MEDTITSVPHVPFEKTAQAIRDQLTHNIQILTSLDPKTAAYQRLAARIERQTDELLDAEDRCEHQRQAMHRALVEQHRSDREFATRSTGFVLILIGGFVINRGWGTWWLVLGAILLLAGLYGLFTKDLDL